MSLDEKNYDDDGVEILNKPSAFISLSPVSKHLSTIQYKYYDILLYNAKEIIAKTGKTDKFEIKMSKLKKMAGDNTTQNKRSKEYLIKLMDLTCTYNILGKEGKMEQNGIFALVAGIDIKTKPGTVIYSFPHQVIEVLVEGLFAKIDMSLIKEFKSKYSIKLYELCKDYENSPRFPEITMDKLGRLLDYEYDRIERIKSCVLNPAIEEINNNDNVGFFVRYALLKSSENKQFHSIQFTVNKRLHYPDELKGRTLSNGSIKLKDGTILPKAETEFTVAIEKESETESKDLKTDFQEPVVINVESVINNEPNKEIEEKTNDDSEEETVVNTDADKIIAENQTDFMFNRQEELNKCYSSQDKKETKEEPLLFDLGDRNDEDKSNLSNGKKQKINFNFKTSEWENIPEDKIALWKSAYPACDIEIALNAMKAWLLENPEKRKINYGKFIVNWLSRTQDNGGNIVKNKFKNNSEIKTFADIRREKNLQVAKEVIEEIRSGKFVV